MRWPAPLFRIMTGLLGLVAALVVGTAEHARAQYAVFDADAALRQFQARVESYASMRQRLSPPSVAVTSTDSISRLLTRNYLAAAIRGARRYARQGDIFTRDKAGTADSAVAEALADAEMPFGDSVPTGTYLDMSANLPVVDPLKVHAPVLLVRGEYDGIATEDDLVSFFRKLPNRDRQLIVLPGMAHSVVLGLNRDQLWHVMRSFLQMPRRHDSLENQRTTA